jgi:serine/threonine protein kinase
MRIAHRDLKLENLMLDENTNIRVIDFGLSNQFKDSSGGMNSAVGTINYVAPEIIKGLEYTKAADIWSEEILLFTVIEGKLPYDDDNIQKLLAKIAYSDIKYPDTFSPALLDLLKKMLNKDPSVRYKIPQIKEHPWFSQNEDASLLSEILNGVCETYLKGVDNEIIEKMQSLGIDTKLLQEAILAGEFNPQTAIYRMFAKAKMTEAINVAMLQLNQHPLGSPD